MDSKNTSGHGSFSVVPTEIEGWNWGAFWLTWIWGIRNRSYISFLAFVPIVSLFIPFYLVQKEMSCLGKTENGLTLMNSIKNRKVGQLVAGFSQYSWSCT